MRYPLTLLCLLALGLGALPAGAQLPEDSRLQDAYFAWDRGEYDDALAGYLQVLTGPGGEAHLEEIALLTGELFRVDELAFDGRSGLRVAPNSRYASYETQEDGESVTRIVDLDADGRTVLTLQATGAALTAGGEVAYVVSDGTVGERELRLRTLPDGAERRVDLEGWIPRAATNSLANVLIPIPDGDGIFVLASREAQGNPTDILHVDGSGSVRVLPTGEGGGKQGIVSVAGGRYLAFTELPASGMGGAAAGSLVVLDLETGVAERFPGRSGASASADGSRLAFTGRTDGISTLEVVSLGTSGIGTPIPVVSTEMEVINPALSPSGATVAFQGRPVHDWEIFAAEVTAEAEIRQVTWEIQHDINPHFLDENTILALKGEARHRRSYLYDVRTGADTKLFHNNTVRTIAPEYEWRATPDGTRILIIADRDGDTISPERGVYLLHLGEKVSLGEVRTRLEVSLAAEMDLRERGTRTYAPIANEVAAVTGRVEVGRIHEYAKTLYEMGSKHITQPGNALAIAHLEAQLRAWGYEPELEWFEPREGVRTANVIARLPGTVDPDLVYVVSSHFDSVERGPGADDNSSGTTALLEAARVMKDHPQPATIEFAFFTGEEAGLLGSREYVRRAIANGKQIVGALNNDMIGWTRNHRLDNTIRYSNAGIRDIQHAAAIQFSDLITYDAHYYRSTDAAAYYEAYGDIVGGIGSYPVLGNPHYHQFTDRLETINHRLVAEVSRVTVATLMLLASSPSRLVALEASFENGQDPGAILLSWDPSPESGIRQYRVRYEILAGDTVEREIPAGTAAGSSPSLRIEGARPGSTVSVRAENDRGLAAWDWAHLALPAP